MTEQDHPPVEDVPEEPDSGDTLPDAEDDIVNTELAADVEEADNGGR